MGERGKPREATEGDQGSAADGVGKVDAEKKESQEVEELQANGNLVKITTLNMFNRDTIDLLEQSIRKVREAEREIEAILDGRKGETAKAGKPAKVGTCGKKDAPAKRGRPKGTGKGKPCCGSRGTRHLTICSERFSQDVGEETDGRKKWKCIECGEITEAAEKPEGCKCGNDLLTQQA